MSPQPCFDPEKKSAGCLENYQADLQVQIGYWVLLHSKTAHGCGLLRVVAQTGSAQQEQEQQEAVDPAMGLYGTCWRQQWPGQTTALEILKLRMFLVRLMASERNHEKSRQNVAEDVPLAALRGWMDHD